MRYPRLFFKNEELVYHVMSRTALSGYVLTDHEKSFLLRLITQLSQVYFFDILAFCIMGNHFHLMVRNRKEHHFSDEEILNRLYNYYPKFRKKPESANEGINLKKLAKYRGNDARCASLVS